jgi:HTH-type transcriptional regulator / antitoxin HipB
VIQNEHQYKVTQNKLKELEQTLAELFQIKDALRSRQFSSRKNGLQMMIDSLRKEIEEYDALKQQQTPIELASIQELPIALIKARIAMGMTQKELAEKMGVKEQQVQRDEANQYSSAGFHRIAEVATALNLKIQETHIFRKS